MYAVLRVNSVMPDPSPTSVAQMEEFDRLHGAQPGFRGTVTVDLGDGRRFLI
jgi:hypothetical protein